MLATLLKINLFNGKIKIRISNFSDFQLLIFSKHEPLKCSRLISVLLQLRVSKKKSHFFQNMMLSLLNVFAWKTTINKPLITTYNEDLTDNLTPRTIPSLQMECNQNAFKSNPFHIELKEFLCVGSERPFQINYR